MFLLKTKKKCYVYNQWYDISCATLYVLLRVTNVTEVSDGTARGRNYDSIKICTYDVRYRGQVMSADEAVHEKSNGSFIEIMKFEVSFFVASDMVSLSHRSK